MPKFVEGSLDASGLRFGIVVGRFNSFISERLLEGALDALVRHGAEDAAITVVRVPGSFEIPLAAQKLAAGGKVGGETPHFDYVAGEASQGLAQASYDSGVPVAFGVLTVETVEQARERSSPARLNKGGEALESALDMALLLRQA